MPKLNKTICLENGVSEKLRDIPNASALINSLLENYFSIIPKDMTYADIEQTEKNIAIKLEALEQRKIDLIEKEEEKQRKIEQQEKHEIIQYEKEKQRNIEKEKLRCEYEKETPKDMQSYESWEKFYNEKKVRL